MSLSDSTLNVRRAASQFIDDFESAVCDLLPAFAAHAYEAERDAIEDAMDDARTAARHDGASPDEIWDATRAACEAAEKASPIVSLIHEHGRACRAAIVALPCGANPVETMRRAAQETARLIAAKVGGGVVVVFSRAEALPSPNAPSYK
jgi:hypothetical protein